MRERKKGRAKVCKSYQVQLFCLYLKSPLISTTIPAFTVSLELTKSTCGDYYTWKPLSISETKIKAPSHWRLVHIHPTAIRSLIHGYTIKPLNSYIKNCTAAYQSFRNSTRPFDWSHQSAAPHTISGLHIRTLRMASPSEWYGQILGKDNKLTNTHRVRKRSSPILQRTR